MTVDFPTSQNEVSEQRKILDKMKKKWRKEEEPTLMDKVHKNEIRRAWEKAKQMELKF